MKVFKISNEVIDEFVIFHMLDMFILEENTRLLFFIFPEWRLVIGFK